MTRRGSAGVGRLVGFVLVLTCLVPIACLTAIGALASRGRDAARDAVASAAREAVTATSDAQRAAIADRHEVALWRVVPGTTEQRFHADRQARGTSDLRVPSAGDLMDEVGKLDAARPPPGQREHVMVAMSNAAGWSAGCVVDADGRVQVCEAAARAADGLVILATQSAPRAASRLLDARRGLLLLGIAVIAAASLLAAWLVRRLTRPLAELARQTQERASGPRAQIALAHAPREVAMVADKIEELTATLEAQATRHAEAAADLAHELKSPLARIRIALDAVELDPSTREQLAVIARGAVRRIDQVVMDLLEIARTEASLRGDTRTPVELRALVAGRVAEHPPPAALAVAIVGDARACVTAPALSRALDHLLDNAYVHARSTIQVVIAREASHLELAVCDDGPGVPRELRARLFERFATGRSGGTGLGLAFVRAVAEAHGGGVWLDEHHAGARIVMRLPVESGATHAELA